MPGWTLVDTHPTGGGTFRRPLSISEHAYFLDGFFNGSADGLQHVELHLTNGSQDDHLFSETNIVRAWLSTKRRYPLAGATVQGSNGPLPSLRTTLRLRGDGDVKRKILISSHPHFIVRERDLAVLRPHEIVFGQVTSLADAQRRAIAILNGPRPLSEELLVQLCVFREAERADVLHLMAFMAHCVADWTANNILVRCFVDTLARGWRSDSEPVQMTLEDRLAVAIPMVELEPARLSSLSPTRRRWRRVIGMVLFNIRMEKMKGGHTIPYRHITPTPHVTAQTGIVTTSLTKSQTTTIIANCRLLKVTFGDAFHPLAQVAMTRVLYRRYLRGEISEEEWAYRKRQPHPIVGPLNLRPFLNQRWYERGGGGEFLVSIGYFYYQLPFMTLGSSMERRQGHQRGKEHILMAETPPFSDFLTFDRFLHRIALIRRQATALYKHPLFFEIILAAHQKHLEHARLAALQWMKKAEMVDDDGVDKDPDLNGTTIFGHKGSSFGDINIVHPVDYPIPPTHPMSPYSSASHPVKAGYVVPPLASQSSPATNATPKITVVYDQIHLHSRPSESYISAFSLHERLNMYVSFDGSVFEEGVVKEWLDEMREAVVWYLGRTHSTDQLRPVQQCLFVGGPAKL